ncbi:MAG: hypothetical protein V3W14_12120, partial [Candidatus Neomarinimicrobiota bacterium]
MQNTLASLAFIKARWSHSKKDYIDTFVPFIATLIIRNKYSSIKADTITTDFTKEFGLDIPYYAMVSILNRARKRGIIKRINNMYKPIFDKALEFEFTDDAKEQMRKYESIITGFIEYALLTHKFEISDIKAEEVLISFLKQHDLDILFAAKQSTLLPDVHVSAREKYILADYLKMANYSQPETFSFFTDIAVGHILANSLLYTDSKAGKYEPTLNGLNIYLDTNFIFRLLGTEGSDSKANCIFLLREVKRVRAKLLVFAHTIEEVTFILEGCREWIESSRYDPRLASSALKYFIGKGFQEDDVTDIIVNIDIKLAYYDINIVDRPEAMELTRYQINEQHLYDTIVEVYQGNNPNFEEKEKQFTIWNDIGTITAIHKLREGYFPRRLKNAKSIFVTGNSSLAYAVRKYETKEIRKGSYLPSCVTDIYLGTIIWLQSPIKIVSMSKKYIMAECYAALQPSDLLIKKFLTVVENLREEDSITLEEYYLLRTYRVSLDLLQEKTMGDPENFSDKTVEQMLDELKARIRKDESEKFLKELQNHDRTKEQLDLARSGNQILMANIEQVANKI